MTRREVYTHTYQSLHHWLLCFPFASRSLPKFRIFIFPPRDRFSFAKAPLRFRAGGRVSALIFLQMIYSALPSAYLRQVRVLDRRDFPLALPSAATPAVSPTERVGRDRRKGSSTS